MEPGPSPTSCSWPSKALQSSLSWRVSLFRESDPTLGSSLAGAAWPSCTSVYHRQAGGGQQGKRAPHSPEGAGGGAAVILWRWGLAGGQGDTSGTPSHTPPGPPSLALELPGCWALEAARKRGPGPTTRLPVAKEESKASLQSLQARKWGVS